MSKAKGDYEQAHFCGCGWPQHLLIPKGTIKGMEVQLFVMISNCDDDQVSKKNGNYESCFQVLRCKKCDTFFIKITS